MPTKRKVCIILGSTYPYTLGGDEKLFTDIANLIMKKKGWEFVVLGRRPRVSRPLAFKKPLPTMIINTLRTGALGRLFEFIYFSFLDSLFFGKRVGALCDDFLMDFDVVITPDPLVTLQITKRKQHPRLIQFVGGAWADTVTAVQRFLGPVVKRIEPNAYKRADCTVFMDRRYAQRFALEQNRFEIIPSGVNPKVFDPSRFERDKLRARFSMTGKSAIITVASLRRGIKGHDFLIRAVPQVVEAYPECHLYLAGKGDQEQFRTQARALGVANHIHFLGERHDIPELLAASDAFVLPSLSEGTPRALLEAMAMELPCIATNVGGIPEIINHQRNGILIEPSVPEAISNAIIHVLLHSKIAKALGKQARKRIITNYSMDAMANAFIELIERLCR